MSLAYCLMSMNILILNWRDTEHPLSGGAEIVTMEHAKRWVKRGHNVTWFTSWYPGAKRKEVVEGIRMIRQAGSLTVYPAAMFYVLFHSHEFDVVIDEVHGFPFCSVFFTNKPVVVFIHEIAGVIWDFMYPFPVNIVGKLLERHYFHFYRQCLFWTDAPSTVEELVKRGIPRKQCVAIPCPIIIHKTGDNKQGVEQSVSSAQCPMSPKNKKPTYLFVSRVVKMKGIEEVIKAFSFIVREQTNAILWIVGSGEDTYIESLKEMMQEYGVLDHVIFWGKVSQEKKYTLMAKAHILLHASVKEGWGLVVLEAASVGTPSVVYDVPGLCDVVKDCQTGIVIHDNSPQEMARQAVSLLINSKKYRLFQKNGKAWSHSLTWADAIRTSLGVLASSIDRINTPA